MSAKPQYEKWTMGTKKEWFILGLIGWGWEEKREGLFKTGLKSKIQFQLQTERKDILD